MKLGFCIIQIRPQNGLSLFNTKCPLGSQGIELCCSLQHNKKAITASQSELLCHPLALVQLKTVSQTLNALPVSCGIHVHSFISALRN